MPTRKKATPSITASSPRMYIITFINKNEKLIHIKFTLGEKKFIFPDAFLMGFLEME